MASIRIIQDFNTSQLWLQSRSIKTSIPINQDFKPGSIMTTNSDLYISHRCVRKDKNEESKIEIADDMLKEKKEVDFRRARHKELYDEVMGNIMYCAECDKTMTTVDIMNNVLERWRDTVIPNEATVVRLGGAMVGLLVWGVPNNTCQKIRDGYSLALNSQNLIQPARNR